MEDFNDLIKIENVCFSYNNKHSLGEIIENFSLSIKKGEFVSLIGGNGCGKSTIAKLINGIVLPNSGDVFVFGMNTKDEKDYFEIKKKVGIVFQNFEDQIVSEIVENDVAFGPENLCIEPKKIEEIIENSLKKVKMLEHKKSKISSLSGGQKQRVAIAGVLAMSPECLIFDEPTSMLNPVGRDEILKIIVELNKNYGKTIILVTHNINETNFSDKIIIINNGKLVKTLNPNEISTYMNLLKTNNIPLNQALELVSRINQKGFELMPKTLFYKDCAEEILNLWRRC